MSEACANCGKAIGELNDPFVWQERVVCGPCYYRLSQPPTPVIADQARPRPGQSHRKQVPWVGLGVLGVIVVYAVGYFMFGWGRAAPSSGGSGKAWPQRTAPGPGLAGTVDNEKAP